MAWETVPPPNYAAFDPGAVGNALANLVANYQGAQQGQQRTQANDIGLQLGRMDVDQRKAFAGGVPMTPAGTPDWSKIGAMEAERGNIGALSELAPLIQQQQWDQNRAPSSAWGGGSSGAAAPAVGGEGGGKGTYSLSQMIRMAENAGFQGEDAAHIASIAMAESGGNPGATGAAGEVGLTQINPNAWGFAASARDPQQAFNDAYQVFKKQGWGAWSTDPTSKSFTPGNSMARFLPQAEADLGRVGGAAGTRVASLDDSVTAYASPDKPAIPPVSAVAGSTIPRANGPTTPIPAAGPPPSPTAVPQQLAANNPAWSGIDAALLAGGAAGPAATTAARPPQPAQTSVQSIASAAGIPPHVTANIAKAVGVAPAAPLTPEQDAKAKRYAQNYVQRTGQQAPAPATTPQAPSGGQGQPSQGGPVIPHIRLPWGLKDPQEAILRLDQEAARLASSPNPYDKAQVALLEDYRNRIAAQSEPVQIGNARFDGWTGKMILQGPSPVTARMEAMQGKADDIAEAIESGDQPPVLTGLYGMAPLVRSALEKNGFDLSKHQLQWDAAKKQVASLNGPQQVRFVGLANSVVNTINEVNDLAEQMQNSGVPLLNKARLAAYIQAEGNSENGKLAARYQTAVGTLKEEFANLANGGYAPTEPAWKLANDQVNGNYGVKELGASLTEIQRLIKYRLNAMPGMSQVGPGSANPYFPDSGQSTPHGASGGGRSEGGAAHPPGAYNYDPATGNLEPVK